MNTILTMAGRLLLKIGGRFQAVGASLIYRAEEGRVTRARTYILAASVAIAAIAAIWIVQASADVAIPGRPQSNRAGAAW